MPAWAGPTPYENKAELLVYFGSDLGSNYILSQALKCYDSDSVLKSLIGGVAVVCKCSWSSIKVPTGKRWALERANSSGEVSWQLWEIKYWWIQNEEVWFCLKAQQCFVSDQIVSQVLLSSFHPEIEKIKQGHNKSDLGVVWHSSESRLMWWGHLWCGWNGCGDDFVQAKLVLRGMSVQNAPGTFLLHQKGQPMWTAREDFDSSHFSVSLSGTYFKPHEF